MGNNQLQSVFNFLPETLKTELLEEYRKIDTSYFENKWESTELGGGKFCEIVYSIIKGLADGQYPNNATKPQNMKQACEELTGKTSLPDSLRLSVPRALVFLYEVRNKRGAGHVGGGEINPNHMDSLVVLNLVRWIMAELIRMLHGTDIETAKLVVEKLTTRVVQLVWSNNEIKRVLEKMDARSQMLVLLYSCDNYAASTKWLATSIEYSNISNFRKKIVQKTHEKRLLEYNKATDLVTLSPSGVIEAEEIICRHRTVA